MKFHRRWNFSRIIYGVIAEISVHGFLYVHVCVQAHKHKDVFTHLPAEEKEQVKSVFMSIGSLHIHFHISNLLNLVTLLTKHFHTFGYSSYLHLFPLLKEALCTFIRGLPRRLRDEESTCPCRRWGFNPWLGKTPWRRKGPLTPVFLLGQSHGQRSLTIYSPWGRKESDTTERLSMHTPSYKWSFNSVESFSLGMISKVSFHIKSMNFLRLWLSMVIYFLKVMCPHHPSWACAISHTLDKRKLNFWTQG